MDTLSAPVKALVWDTFGTVVDWRRPVMRQAEALGRRLGVEGDRAELRSAQWDDVFADGAMFKHGNLGQGIYVDPARDFCGVHFATGPNQSGIDWSPGYQRAAAKMLAGK